MSTALVDAHYSLCASHVGEPVSNQEHVCVCKKVQFLLIRLILISVAYLLFIKKSHIKLI